MNLTQLLLTQNNGAAIDQLSQQFGLNQKQTVSAIEALMPAFSTGLKRNVARQSGAADLIQALARGSHQQYVDQPEMATSAAGIQEGNAILGHLFGNKDVSRAVASHAAASTGLGASLLKQMLPAIASMVMGALFKGATGGRGGGLGGALGQAAGGGLLGTILEGLVGGMAGGARTRRRRTRNPLEDILGQVLGGGQSRAPRQRRRRADPIMPPTRRTTNRNNRQQNGGLGDLLDQLTGGSNRSRRQAPAPRRRTGQRGGLEQIFGDMLEPGGNTDTRYRRETGSVFDEFLGPSGR